MSDCKQFQQKFFPFVKGITSRGKLICTLYYHPYFHLKKKIFTHFRFFHIMYVSPSDILRSLKLVPTFQQVKIIITD